MSDEYTIDLALKDILYLGKRVKALEEDLQEWTEFMTTEMLKNGVRIHKNKTSFEYFRKSLNNTFKQTYEKFEGIFKRNKIFDKKKRTYKDYT